MNKKPSITLLFIFLFIIKADIYSQNAPVFPRLSPDPRALEFYNLNAQGSGLTWLELASAALWASGNTSNLNIAQHGAAQIPVDASSPLARIYTEAAALINSPEYPDSGRERAEFILEYLYRNILRTYSLTQTRVDTIFTNGRYNCVSSAVLYMIFCEYSGINSSGVITRDHALLTVHISGEDIDVETTNRHGFDPGNRREFHDQFGRLTGFTYVPARNYRDRQTINKMELISIIFNNRINELERQGRWAEAVPLAIDKAALIYGASLNAPMQVSSAHSDSQGKLFIDPRSDLLDRLFNYGVSLLRSNREEDCLLWAAAASSIYPDEDRWQEFILAAVNNRMARFLRERKITEAGNLLNDNKNLLTEENYSALNEIILEYKAADYHNRFAAEWNRRNYTEAERILNEALTEFPDNRQLISDREIVDRQRAR